MVVSNGRGAHCDGFGRSCMVMAPIGTVLKSYGGFEWLRLPLHLFGTVSHRYGSGRSGFEVFKWF